MNLLLKTILLVSITPSMVFSAVSLPINAAFNPATDVPAAFEGPFVYEGETTVTYKYLTADCNTETDIKTMGTREIDNSKTVTITEEQVLTYYLHKPIHYDSSKSYPIVSYVSGDGISIFCDAEIPGTSVNISSFIEGSDYYSLHDKYRQNTSYGTTYINGWGTSIDTQGNYLTSFYQYIGDKKQALKLPHFDPTASNKDDQFVIDWCDLVYNQGREEFDCFFLFLQPTDREAFENKSNKKLLTIQNELQVKSIYDKYDSNVIIGQSFYTAAHINTTYVASELSIDPTEQLLCQLIDDLMLKYNINPARQYVAGFSLGAMFSYDICCHYSDRFACVLTTGLPTVDFSESNLKAWTKTNFWGFNGTGDFCDANSRYAKEFVKQVNLKKKPDSTIKTMYSVCSGGHSGNYIAGRGTVTDGQAIESYTDTFNFMFNSVKPTECLVSSNSMKNAFEEIELDAKVSSSLTDDKYDLAFVTGAPIGEFTSHGFIINDKTVYVSGQVKEDKVVLGGNEITFKATDYKSMYMYDFVLRDVPSTVSSFTFQAFAQSTNGIYYSKKMLASVTIAGTAVTLEVSGL